METDEFLHLLHLGVVARRARVQALDDGADVAKDTGVHQRWNNIMSHVTHTYM